MPPMAVQGENGPWITGASSCAAGPGSVLDLAVVSRTPSARGRPLGADSS